ncbi:MAG: phytoene desaturase [Bacteroidia bacterium]|nr:phytoene desaturase [Bacteroidia bacterium]MCF8426590.1 phytoene desaturase [Bacteroidia bacterium]MCF8446752.1 phytoene desaturase [Bacteroidia bacterium]
MKRKKAIVIGSGVAGLAAASYLGKAGYEVDLLEKNDSIGGRARQFKEKGFVFDMGPSWYWMPDVFEKFYQDFGHTTADFYELIRLSPSYRVIAKNGDAVDIPADMKGLEELFEKYEPGSAIRLRKFLKEAEYKYEVGINDLVYKPSLSLLEFADMRLLKGLLKMDVLTSMRKHVGDLFTHPFLIELLEFPVLFLGALPQNTPALYSLMNYADMQLGTWYPQGGMFGFIEAFSKIAKEQGVNICLNQEVISVETENGIIRSVQTKTDRLEADVIIAAGDYHHFEQKVLKKEDRMYSESYWDKRKMAPSCILFYIGLDKKLPNMLHHTLFFDTDFNLHSKEIYTNPQWPSNPLFYVSVPSKTDPSVAPEDCENLFLLIPIAPGLENDSEEIREKYLKLMDERLKKYIGFSILPHIIYKRSYSVSDFKNDYHAFKGNAYGLANTLDQTAILKPRLKSKKLKNLYFAGQLTVPGPGVPPSIISGKVAAMQVLKDFEN